MSCCNISTEGTIAARLTHPVFDVFDENSQVIFHSGFCMPPQQCLQSIQCKEIRQGHPLALFFPSIIIQCLMVPSISGQVLGAEKSLQTHICHFLIFIAYIILPCPNCGLSQSLCWSTKWFLYALSLFFINCPSASHGKKILLFNSPERKRFPLSVRGKMPELPLWPCTVNKIWDKPPHDPLLCGSMSIVRHADSLLKEIC